MPFPNKTFNNKTIAIKAGIKGGKNVTEKQRIAATLGQWKRYGVNTKCGEKVMLMLQSRDFTAADWFKHVDILEQIAEQDPKFLPALVNMKKDWARFAHGDTLKTENVHHIINWTEERKTETINRLLDENYTTPISDDSSEK